MTHPGRRSALSESLSRRTMVSSVCGTRPVTIGLGPSAGCANRAGLPESATSLQFAHRQSAPIPKGWDGRKSDDKAFAWNGKVEEADNVLRGACSRDAAGFSF